MFVAPAHLEARDAIRRSDMEIQARQNRAPTSVTPDPADDGGDIISMILSGIFGGIGDEQTTTTTRSTSTRSTSTRSTSTTTSSTRSTSSSASTRTTAEVVTTPPPVVTTPTPSSTRPTTIITQTANNANNTANDTSKNNKGLPSVVIGVIVAAAVIFGLIFIALIARKIFQAKRRRRRATWAENGGISPFQDPLVREKALPPPPPPETTQDYASYPAYPPAAVTFANQPAPYSPAAASSAGYPAPYPFGGTGNVAQPNGALAGATTTAAMFQSSSAYSPADLAGPVVIQQTPPTPIAGSTIMPAGGAQLSVVKRTFIPSLPDELSIANGEQVRVLSLYDDGWALCEKVATGEKGVVPQECLESAQPSTSNTPAQQLAGSEESARLNRNSSLRRGQEQTY